MAHDRMRGISVKRVLTECRVRKIITLIIILVYIQSSRLLSIE